MLRIVSFRDKKHGKDGDQIVGNKHMPKINYYDTAMLTNTTLTQLQNPIYAHNYYEQSFKL